VVACVDPSLYADPDPQVPCPTGEPERTFPLDFAENLIGRRSDRRDIHPEIPLSDPGVSHRHAKLLRQADGSFVLLDVGSTNGTQLNGVDVREGVRTPLQDGDQITLGCWTRLTIRSLA
jgi:pSer/pThr/pTyr-binding forkhead associated (FHA) protein